MKLTRYLRAYFGMCKSLQMQSQQLRALSTTPLQDVQQADLTPYV